LIHPKVLLIVVACVLALGLTACGGTSGTPPTITTQPQSQTVGVGATATFTVVASGSVPLHYQWMENGMAISGATSASYTTPVLTLADNNEQFAVVVSNSSGSVTSSAATLTVLAVP
jgi:beta-galactosidase